MTIAELIEVLQKMDPAMVVVRAMDDGSFEKIGKDLYQPEIVKMTYSDVIDGYFEWDDDGEPVWGVVL